MRSVLRKLYVGAVLVGVSATAVQAQRKVEEIRIDLAGATVTGGLSLGAGIPGGLALGVYLSDKLAIEPRANFGYDKPEGGDGTLILDLGVYAPFYLSGDRGHSGLFIAPGFSYQKFGDADGELQLGADVGMKRKLSEKLSYRFAAEIRNPDDLQIGGVFGVSIWWR
jgi:hypothetical protein